MRERANRIDSQQMSASLDDLGLAHNAACQKMLSKMGDNFPDQEKVVLSTRLIKINKRGKSQNRVLLVTDKAMFVLFCFVLFCFCVFVINCFCFVLF